MISFIYSLPLLLNSALPPKALPQGLAHCEHPIEVQGGHLEVLSSEELRYDLSVLGLKVGKAALKQGKVGRFAGQTVADYRAKIDVNPLMRAIVHVEGSAAALISTQSGQPLQARSKYRLANRHYQEQQSFRAPMVIDSRKNEGAKTKSRAFDTPALDFLSFFYALRGAPNDQKSCAVIYAYGKAFTIWIKPAGIHILNTIDGATPVTLFDIRYAGEGERTIKSARVYVGTNSKRVLYRAEGLAEYRVNLELSSRRTAG